MNLPQVYIERRNNHSFSKYRAYIRIQFPLAMQQAHLQSDVCEFTYRGRLMIKWSK